MEFECGSIFLEASFTKLFTDLELFRALPPIATQIMCLISFFFNIICVSVYMCVKVQRKGRARKGNRTRKGGLTTE